MNELEVKRVPFMGTDLMAAKDESGTIWAGVRWMCDGMGLSEGQTKSERLRIQNDSVLSKGGRNLVLPSKGGNQSTLCLKLDFVPQQINACCDKLGISRALLNATDVARLTGYSRGTVRSKFRFGGTSRHRVISRSQLARQIADLTRYSA